MKKIEKLAQKFLKERGWDKLRPADISKSISIEAGELLELFQWENLPFDQIKNDEEKIKGIEKELADVFLYSFYMAVTLGISPEKIIKDKLAYASKKFPPHLFKKNTGKDPGTEETYWKIKKGYRRKGLS